MRATLPKSAQQLAATWSTVAAVLAAVAAFMGPPAVGSAQMLTQVYSFEPDLEGFGSNGGGVTLSLNTDSNFASEGTNSMKLQFMDFANFAGGLTEQVDLQVFNDPPGVDFVRFDLIVPSRFVPDEPVIGEDPTFASTSVTLFGEFADEPGVGAQIQFQFSEVLTIGDLEPGTHEIDIDLTDGGVHTQGGVLGGFNEFVADGFVTFGFQIYINKSFSFEDPDFAWTVYIDNIRTGVFSEGLGGDYNGDGVVDAADYTVWRDNLGGAGPAGDGTTTGDLLGVPDGVVDAWDYQYWVQQYGATLGGGSASAAATPAPGGALLALAAGACLAAGRGEPWRAVSRERSLADGRRRGAPASDP